MAEILILGCFGIGHYTPELQFSRACIQALNSMRSDKESRVTMILPLLTKQARCIAEEGESFTFTPGEWNLRIVDDGQIIQWIMATEGDYVDDNVFRWFCESQLTWPEHIKEVYKRRNAKPDVIIADMAVCADEELIALWGVPCYSFVPSPLLVHWFIPATRGFGVVKDVDRALMLEEEPTTGTFDDSDLHGRSIAIPGFDDLSLDLESETFVREEALRELMVEFVARQMRADRRRQGLICNDVTEFYPPHWDRFCKPHPDYKIFCIGPLALNFDRRASRRNGDLRDWLNARPANSVIFVSIGSQFDLPSATLLEFTKAFTTLLEADQTTSIVWAHRPAKEAPVEFETDELGLPRGWLEKHSERVIVKSWVNQLEILQNPALTLFITHCGWNGLFEGIAIGQTPLLMVPVNAEQPMNAKLMEAHHKVGERLWAHPYFAPPLPSERIVEKINNCRNNQAYKENQKALKQTALSAWDSNGSSREAFKTFITSIAR